MCTASAVRLALFPPLLAKLVDDLLQPLACVGFAISWRDNTTSRVDAEKFVQIALLIQCLRLWVCKARASKICASSVA